MSKRIAFCADSTWDTAASHTNVYKLYKALITSADQISAYDDGVGSDGNPLIRLLGGAFGTGLWKKIKEAYTKIAHVYEQDDQLFLSREPAFAVLRIQHFIGKMKEECLIAYREQKNRICYQGQRGKSETNGSRGCST